MNDATWWMVDRRIVEMLKLLIWSKNTYKHKKEKKRKKKGRGGGGGGVGRVRVGAGKREKEKMERRYIFGREWPRELFFFFFIVCVLM
jgi:hypothetical protein